MNEAGDRQNCITCNSPSIEFLTDQERNGDVHMTYICRECGQIFSLPRPDEESLEELYQKGQFSKKFRGATVPSQKKLRSCEKAARRRALALERILAENGVHSRERKVLDVGCGTGSFVAEMKKRGWLAVGMELDPVYAGYCEQYYGITINKGLLSEDSFPYRFDLIAAFHVIEHVGSPIAFLKTLISCATNKGIIVIECPGAESWPKPNLRGFFWKPHVNSFTLRSLVHIMERAGLEILYAGYNAANLFVVGKIGAKAAAIDGFRSDFASSRDLVQRRLAEKGWRQARAILASLYKRAKYRIEKRLGRLSPNYIRQFDSD